MDDTTMPMAPQDDEAKDEGTIEGDAAPEGVETPETSDDQAA